MTHDLYFHIENVAFKLVPSHTKTVPSPESRVSTKKPLAAQTTVCIQDLDGAWKATGD